VDISRLSPDLHYSFTYVGLETGQETSPRREVTSESLHLPALHPLWPLAERTRHDIVSGTTEARRRRATHARDTPPQ
jgi:hypothetical protein